MIRKLIVLLAVCLVPVCAHAQLAVYGTISITRMGGLNSSPYAANLGANAVDSSINPLGVTVGGYYDFKTLGPFRLGADVRGVIETTKRGAETGFNGVGGRLHSVLGGVRGSVRTPFKILDGYVQVSAGLGQTDYGFPPVVIDPALKGSTNIPAQTLLKNNVEYHAFAGLQLHILPYADFRVVELGYGGLEGGSHNYPLSSVSTGIVLHFPSAQ